jgi:hypothetical protein
MPAVPKFFVVTLANELVQLISMFWLLSAWSVIFHANWLVSGAHTAERLGATHALAVPPKRTRETSSIAIVAVAVRVNGPTLNCKALPTFGTRVFLPITGVFPQALSTRAAA